jgi:hypothetical protein
MAVTAVGSNLHPMHALHMQLTQPPLNQLAAKATLDGALLTIHRHCSTCPWLWIMHLPFCCLLPAWNNPWYASSMFWADKSSPRAMPPKQTTGGH